MAAQQIQIAETIRAMKLALKRRPDDSESDGGLRSHTNRGHKLKRPARHVRDGRLDDTGGLAYRRRARHAGHERATISTNLPRFDSDGEPHSPRSSDDDRPAEPLEEDPFGEVRLEALLRPLTAVHELPDHPSLGAAYRSKGLTQMTAEAAEMLRGERESLWRAKRLLARFRGEADWAPSGIFETEDDSALLRDSGTAAARGEKELVRTVEGGRGAAAVGRPAGVDVTDMALQTAADSGGARGTTGGIHYDADPVPSLREGDGPPPAHGAPGATELDAASVSGSSKVHAMTTRARARSPQPSGSGSGSPSPSDSASVPTIHPWFLIPSGSLPDRDLGLPADEAESTRKLLLLYGQKQEQVVRSLEALYSGLRRGDRLRHSTAASARAAGHLVPDGKGVLVTELSDGEDWYDPQEYGRLEKGKDEIEDVEEEGRRGGRRRRVVGRV